MYNWLLTGGVEVDWAIAIGAFIILMAVACLTGYIYGFDEGYERRNGVPFMFEAKNREDSDV